MKVLSSITGKKVQLDLKDRKILRLLSQNSRLSSSRIAKTVELSRDAVAYRIKRLESNVITGYRTLISPKALGYASYHLFLALHHPNKEEEEKTIANFTKNQHVNAILKYSGKWDFEIAVMAKNIQDFDREFKEITNACGTLQDFEILILLETIRSESFPTKFMDYKFDLKGGKNDGSFAKDFTHNKDETNPDELDYKILAILSDNARISLTELAKQLKTSIDTITYRIRKLIRGKIILEFRPAINYALLGFSVYALLIKFHNINEQKEKMFTTFIKNHPTILWATKTIGKWGMLIYIIAQDQTELHETIISMRNNFGEIIQSYETLLAYEEYKYTYLPDELKPKS